MIPFTHLHVHSQYSILDGQASINSLINKAQDDGMEAVALTDHGNMFGIKEFWNSCRSAKYGDHSVPMDEWFKIKIIASGHTLSIAEDENGSEFCVSNKDKWRYPTSPLDELKEKILSDWKSQGLDYAYDSWDDVDKEWLLSWVLDGDGE